MQAAKLLFKRSKILRFKGCGVQRSESEVRTANYNFKLF